MNRRRCLPCCTAAATCGRGVASLCSECSCKDANQDLHNNYILLRLPYRYVQHLRSENAISHETFSTFATTPPPPDPTTSNILAFVPLPAQADLTTVEPLRNLSYETCPLPPSFADEMVQGLGLRMGTDYVPFRRTDALFSASDVRRLRLLYSVEDESRTLQGGLWVVGGEPQHYAPGR